MSTGYASRLKDYPNKGTCGLKESFDTPRSLSVKVQRLVDMMRQARARGGRVVVCTGAGISTAAGIPDFRGPQGVWTLEQEEKKRKRHANGASRKRSRDPAAEPASIDFSVAKPTYTHRAIATLVEKGDVSFCITQNVDGLHQRSGLSRDKLAVLHGCAFTERCDRCRAEYFRDFEVGGMSFQPTGRTCGMCGGELCDTLLDWEDALPERDFDLATAECESAELVVCLGTSLRIEPAGSLPTQCRQYVIVNLQVTPKDEGAAMIIRGRTDDVMKGVIEALKYEAALNDDLPIEREWVPKT
jgi:NAD+-dependent protein deacetylase sirtuin 6